MRDISGVTVRVVIGTEPRAAWIEFAVATELFEPETAVLLAAIIGATTVEKFHSLPTRCI
jgi:hypothetical protein